MNKRAERGMTMLVVLVLLSVMLLGGLALARMTEVGTLAAGNSAFRETALQASEIGINAAFDAVQNNLVNTNSNVGTWYFAQRQTDDDRGIPQVNFNDGQPIVVGAYTLHYVVDRVCGLANVTDPLRQCLVKEQLVNGSAAVTPNDPIDPPLVPQFRVTVRVTGPKDTQVWVQSLFTKGTVTP